MFSRFYKFIVSAIYSLQKIIQVEPDKMPVTTAATLLKEIMPANNNDSRRFYNVITFYLGIYPFLSKSDDEAMVIRKKRIVPYLHALQKNIDFADEMKKLVDQLQKNSLYKSNIEIINNHFISLLSRGIIGIEFPVELRELLSTAHRLNPAPFLLLPNLLTKLLLLVPSIRKFRNTYSIAIRNFLIDLIRELKLENSALKKMEKSFILDLIAEKKINVESISENEIAALADDPEFRMCMAIILGTHNLTEVLTALVLNLQSSTFKNLKIEILSQDRAIDYSTPKELLDKTKMPLLHATYLESLRFGSTTNIARKTQAEIKLEDRRIPANSFVIFPLSSLARMGNSQYPAKQFHPERFINDENQLRDDMQLNDKLFTPFAVGPRMCPGQHMTEQMIKLYLVTLIYSVKYFLGNTFLLYDDAIDDNLQTHIYPILKDSIRYSLFAPTKSGHPEEAEKIIEHIKGYCVR